MKILGLVGALMAVSLAGQVGAAEKKPEVPMSAQQVQALVRLKDDSLETLATFDTLAAMKRYTWTAPEAQAFLRAHVTKQTGSAAYQVYSVVRYTRDWRFYETANYETEGAPQNIDLTKLGRDVGSCRYGCTFTEQVAFELSEAQMRAIAARPSESKWKFRLKSKAGVDSDVEMEPGMFGGLLLAVDAYRAAHPIAAAPTN